MAMAKFLAFMLLAFLAISMLQTMVMASHGHGGHHKVKKGLEYSDMILILCLESVCNDQNAHRSAREGAAGPSITSPACSSARSVAPSACASHQASTGTKVPALATTTGRPRKEDPNALNQIHSPSDGQ
ncbi:hypothetical protein RJ639_030201 [Escallonia herrerae]|uniref:Uncharacterized protein n=1 Tax=Escallonia herrerae TaxID=1293975 RepID=A0AA89BHE9_9ASTE|nr:hypothetical protein RJ639_030201 [Escallonia herrerae]